MSSTDKLTQAEIAAQEAVLDQELGPLMAQATAELRREPEITISCGYCSCIMAKMSLDRFTKYGVKHEATCVQCKQVNVVGPFSRTAEIRRKQ